MEENEPGHCGVNNSRSSDPGLFSSQKYVDTVPRKRAHTSSVNREGTSRALSSLQKEFVAREYGQKTLDNRQWSCPVSEPLFGPEQRKEGESRRGRDKMFRKVKEGVLSRRKCTSDTMIQREHLT